MEQFNGVVNAAMGVSTQKDLSAESTACLYRCQNAAGTAVDQEKSTPASPERTGPLHGTLKQTMGIMKIVEAVPANRK